jgi:hypothetical protein
MSKFINIDPKHIASVGKEEHKRALKRAKGAVKEVKGNPPSKSKPDSN